MTNKHYYGYNFGNNFNITINLIHEPYFNSELSKLLKGKKNIGLTYVAAAFVPEKKYFLEKSFNLLLKND
jgi:hypothetical protein